MINEKIEIREEELNAVNGGYHLSSNEVKALKPGQRLMLENNFGQNIALVSYEGELRNPGTFSMLQAKVRIIEVYDRGVRKHGDSFSSYIGEKNLEVGDVIYASRYYLDFLDRA